MERRFQICPSYLHLAVRQKGKHFLSLHHLLEFDPWTVNRQVA